MKETGKFPMDNNKYLKELLGMALGFLNDYEDEISQNIENTLGFDLEVTEYLEKELKELKDLEDQIRETISV